MSSMPTTICACGGAGTLQPLWVHSAGISVAERCPHNVLQAGSLTCTTQPQYTDGDSSSRLPPRHQRPAQQTTCPRGRALLLRRAKLSAPTWPPHPTCCCLARMDVEGRRGTPPNWLSPESDGPLPGGGRRTLRERGRPTSPPRSSPRFLNQSPTCWGEAVGRASERCGSTQHAGQSGAQLRAAVAGGAQLPRASRNDRPPLGRRGAADVPLAPLPATPPSPPGCMACEQMGAVKGQKGSAEWGLHTP